MVNILYILMEVHGMMKHVMSWDETLFTFIISEKFDGKSQPVFQG